MHKLMKGFVSCYTCPEEWSTSPKYLFIHKPWPYRTESLEFISHRFCRVRFQQYGCPEKRFSTTIVAGALFYSLRSMEHSSLSPSVDLRILLDINLINAPVCKHFSVQFWNSIFIAPLDLIFAADSVVIWVTRNTNHQGGSGKERKMEWNELCPN